MLIKMMKYYFLPTTLTRKKTAKIQTLVRMKGNGNSHKRLLGG